MRSTRRRALFFFAAITTALAASSCLGTRNFREPTGPRYEGSYGAPLHAESPAVLSAPDSPLRVVTFNLPHGRDPERALALLRAEPLKGFDVLLLQEMDSARVERIARELRLNYVYFPSAIHPFSDAEFGAAILSPWPLTEYRKIPLPHVAFGTRVSRAVTSAVLTRGALRVRVYAVHLPATAAITPEERQEQVRMIADDAKRFPGPVVIGGDFNSRSVGPWLRDSGFLWLTEKIPGTARGFGHWWKFDHLFARGLAPAPPGPATGVVDSAGASDHRAVWALLQPAPAQP